MNNWLRIIQIVVSRKRSKLWASLLIVIGVFGLASSAILYALQPSPPEYTNYLSILAKPPSSVRPSTKAIANYSVAPYLPKYINIPSIGIDKARIIRLGHFADGQIATPNNIYDTGWYENSSLPGKPGAMFVFGHVSSWTADGVFFNSKTMSTGLTKPIILSIKERFGSTYKYMPAQISISPK